MSRKATTAPGAYLWMEISPCFDIPPFDEGVARLAHLMGNTVSKHSIHLACIDKEVGAIIPRCNIPSKIVVSYRFIIYVYLCMYVCIVRACV